MLRYLVSYFWAIVWAVIVLLLMGMASDDLPNVRFFVGFDKLAHCGCFFVLGVLLLFGTVTASKGKGSKIGAVLSVGLVSGLFAFLTEAVQFYLQTGRTAEWWDIFADFVGIGMAVFAYLVLYRKRSNQQPKSDPSIH